MAIFCQSQASRTPFVSQGPARAFVKSRPYHTHTQTHTHTHARVRAVSTPSLVSCALALPSQFEPLGPRNHATRIVASTEHACKQRALTNNSWTS